MCDDELGVRLGEGEGESSAVSMHKARNMVVSSLVDARQHDEAVHQQQPETAPAHPEDQQSHPHLPARPCAEEEGARPALLPEASQGMASPPYVGADQWPYAARGLVLVVFVFALCGAPDAWVRAVAATPNVDQRDRRLQFRLRVLRRVAPSRRLHLRVQLDVGVVRVVDGAGAGITPMHVAVLPLSVFRKLCRVAREAAEEVERLPERVLRRPGECA